MNKAFGFLLAFNLLFASPLDVFARSKGGLGPEDLSFTMPNGYAAAAEQAVVSFADLGYDNTNLLSPIDTTRIFFSLPLNWRLTEGSEVKLDFDVVLTGSDISASDASPFGGTLTVAFNGQIIGALQLTQSGSESVRLAIPPEAFQSIRDDGRHQLTISLDAQLSCSSDSRTLVTIKSTSLFDLDFDIVTPAMDLSKLPAPFFLRNSLLPDKTLVIVPDQPTAGEMQAALNVMAGFGAMIGTPADIQLVSAGTLGANDIASSHLVFVGKPSSFPQIEGVEFPLPISGGQFVNLPQASTNDGVLELAISPWNQNKVVLLVSGNADEAVGKASRAFSSGSVFVYDNPTLAYVSDIRLTGQDLPIVEDFTLSSIGYSNETLSGVGLDSVEYLFKVSKEQVAAQDATIDLYYFHSGLLDYGASSFTVEVNDQIVLSSALGDESEQLTSLHIKIPPDVLRFGVNRLVVSARMLTDLSCDTSGFSDPWFIVSDQTQFHLPVSDAASINPSQPDFKFYPRLFTTHSELSDLAFVLPKSSPKSWAIAGRLAYDLGKVATPSIANLGAVYGDDVPQEIRESKSLLFVGKASSLPLLGEINDKLPAPFDLQSDTAVERGIRVSYRIPPGVSVGYLEIAISPFNPEMYILVVSGNTEDGLGMSGNALLTPATLGSLTGVFAVTNGTQVASAGDASLSSVVGQVVPDAEQVVVTPLPGAPSAQPLARPWWLYPVIAGSGLVVLVVFIIIIRSAQKVANVPVVSSDTKDSETSI